MLTKCSNSSCSASFRYLHSGRLFHFEKRLRPTLEAEAPRMRSNGVEFFWLCEDCAAEYTLVPDRAQRVRVVPLAPRALRAAS